MDKIAKFLAKLSVKERNELMYILEKIILLDLEVFDVKKLKNEKNLFRVRKGNIRIIFRKEDQKGLIINIDYRSGVYKDL